MENVKRMEPSNVTPKLIKYLPENKSTMVQFIPGYVLKNSDFEREDLWEYIVRPIKTIHRSGIELPCTFNPQEEIIRLYKVLEGLKSKYPGFNIVETIVILDKIAGVADVPQSQYVPCHNDLLADNFILVSNRDEFKGPMYLIDWEYGGMGPAYYDNRGYVSRNIGCEGNREEAFGDIF